MRGKIINLISGIGLIFVGCVLNNVFLELIINKKYSEYADPGAGTLLTLLQFLLVTILSANTVIPAKNDEKGLFGLRKLSVPLRLYCAQTAIFFVMSFLNNKAFDYKISQPMHMVFRSCELIVMFGVGLLCFGKRYSVLQFTSVVMLSAGAAFAMSAEAHSASCCDSHNLGNSSLPDGNASNHTAAAVGSSDNFFRWCCGVAMLTAVMVLGAALGQFQGWIRDTYGAHAEEGKFMTHALSLPLFLLAFADLKSHAQLWAASPPLVEEFPAAFSGISSKAESLLALLGAVPTLWAYVAGNVITQYMCISGVFLLNSSLDPLAVKLTLTVRKFSSLLVSIWYFQHQFTWSHWIGSTLVFGGVVLYIQATKLADATVKRETLSDSRASQQHMKHE